MIETARHHREFIQDPVLKQRVTSLIDKRRFILSYTMNITMRLKMLNTLSIYTVSWAKTSLNMCFEIPAAIKAFTYGGY